MHKQVRSRDPRFDGLFFTAVPSTKIYCRPVCPAPMAKRVAYYASAEIGCHLALGWPVPQRVLDLFTEFRNHTNGVYGS